MSTRDKPVIEARLGPVSCITDRNASAASVTFTFGDREYMTTGSSKRQHGDVFDPQTGAALALARAFRTLAGQLEGTASRRVSKAEEARQRQVRRSAAREERRKAVETAQRYRGKHRKKVSDARDRDQDLG